MFTSFPHIQKSADWSLLVKGWVRIWRPACWGWRTDGWEEWGEVGQEDRRKVQSVRAILASSERINSTWSLARFTRWDSRYFYCQQERLLPLKPCATWEIEYGCTSGTQMLNHGYLYAELMGGPVVQIYPKARLPVKVVSVLLLVDRDSMLCYHQRSVKRILHMTM